MKNFKYLLIMLVALTVSVSCSNDDDSEVDPLVGAWKNIDEDDDATDLIFKKDFTGIFYAGMGEEWEEIYNFTWSTEDNLLTFAPPILVYNGIVAYSISDNTLTLRYRPSGEDDETILIFARQ